MNIASMLNLSTGPNPQKSVLKDGTPPLVSRAGFTAPSSLPTPSPECLPAKQASEIKDSRVRTPWDAGGYSLPRDAAPYYQRSSFSFRPTGEPVDTPPTGAAPTTGGHSRHASIASIESPMSMAAPNFPTPFPNARQARRMHSTSDVQQDLWMRRSSYCDPRPQPDSRRSSLWTDHGAGLPVGMGSSPRHRISDSRSSFSSLCSSTFSGGHSRFSSMSTVSGHQASSVAAEMPLLESKLEQLPKLTPTPEYAEHQESSPRLPPLSKHAAMPPRAPSLPQGNHSDLVLDARAIKRKRSRLSVDQSHSSLRSSVLHPLDRIHKRTISAPNPPQLSSSPFTHVTSYLPPITPESLEAVPQPPHLAMPRARRSVSRGRRAGRNDISPIGIPASRSIRPMEEVMTNTDGSPPPQTQVVSTPIASSSNFQSRLLNTCNRFGLSAGANLRGGDICMHVDNCNTGSVPRKVISHLFGRNKVCTRRIPERAWVCMCRKHYQRIRYRRGAEFSMTQIDLVYEQIARMIFWSQGLENNGGANVEGIFIRSWTFSIRKRELRRLVESNGQDPLPRWIIQSLGEGKTHDDILNVVERLHHDIQQGILRDVPPVEFLPEVVDTYTLRATHSPNTTKHERSNDIDMQDAVHSGGSLEEDEGSPFSKDTSPLEPVEEENIDYRSPREEAVSPGTSAVSDDTQRPPTSLGYHQRQQSDSQIYASRDQMDFPQSDDRRNSHPEFDSQNPQNPQMNAADVNFQIQESAIVTRDPQAPLSNTSIPQGPASGIIGDRILINGQPFKSQSYSPSIYDVSRSHLNEHLQDETGQLEVYAHQYQMNHNFRYIVPPLVQSQDARLPYSGPFHTQLPQALRDSQQSRPAYPKQSQATNLYRESFGRSWHGHHDVLVDGYRTQDVTGGYISDTENRSIIAPAAFPIDGGESLRSPNLVDTNIGNVPGTIEELAAPSESHFSFSSIQDKMRQHL